MAESKTSKVTNYRDLIVPLEKIVRLYPEIMTLLGKAGDDAIVVALRTVLELMFNLWYTADEQWIALRNRVRIGLVKDTKKYGNTSVSQGCAVNYFSTNPDKTNVAFLNCGTGGIKYQVYKNDNGLITVVSEFKPENGASPQVFAKPLGDETSKEIVKQHTLLKSEMEASGIPFDCEVFAFVTGTIRANWENGSTTERVDFDSYVEMMFAAIPAIKPISPTSFFLTQDAEGELESLGTTSMYDNLSIAGELQSGVRTAAIIGIGRGSVQLTWQNADRTRQYPINKTPGMNDVRGLSNWAWRVLPEIRGKIGTLVDFMSTSELPTIALKSGCMLYLTKPAGAQLLALLTEEPAVEIPEPISEPVAKAVSIVASDVATATNNLVAEIVQTYVPDNVDTVMVHTS